MTRPCASTVPRRRITHASLGLRVARYIKVVCAVLGGREAIRRHIKAETNNPMHYNSQQAQLRNARSTSLKQRWRLSDQRSEIEGLMHDLELELLKQRERPTQPVQMAACANKLNNKLKEIGMEGKKRLGSAIGLSCQLGGAINAIPGVAARHGMFDSTRSTDRPADAAACPKKHMSTSELRGCELSRVVCTLASLWNEICLKRSCHTPPPETDAEMRGFGILLLACVWHGRRGHCSAREGKARECTVVPARCGSRCCVGMSISRVPNPIPPAPTQRR
eukprot:985811-Prymnesium_polylepis.2